MAADNPKKRLWDETTCSICLDFFTDPVILNCGHNFCKACILECREKSLSSSTPSCPQCRETIQQKSLRPNWQLANVVEIAKQLNDQATKEAAAARGFCERHQEPLKLFCRDDEAPICVVCDRSKEHREHCVVPAEEAAEEYKDQICTSLENLRKKKEELLASKENTGKQSQDLLNMIERERQKTVAAFRLFRQVLEEEEKLLLARMEEVDKEIVKKRDEDMARLLEELSSLEKIIQEMEEKCEKPPCELLEGIVNTLRRCEQEKFEMPVDFPPALKWRVWEFWDFSPVLENATKNFKDTLISEYRQYKEKVTLDPETAHPQLLISEDGKCLTLGDILQSLPETLWRFDYHQCVLGSAGFQSGRHCWEVDVSEEEGWAVGVCAGHCPNDKATVLGPATGVWAIGKWEGLYQTVVPPLNPPLLLSGEPNKIRVSLNCMGRQVTFFDADTAALLCSYSIPADSSSTYYPFFWLWKNSCLRLNP